MKANKKIIFTLGCVGLSILAAGQLTHAAKQNSGAEVQFNNSNVLSYEEIKTEYTSKNYDSSYRGAKVLAAQGNAKAINLLALHYYYGHGARKELQISRDLFQQAMEKGNATAADNLGMLAESEGNFNSALLLYSKAEKMGYAVASYHKGLLYEYGKGVRKSINNAIKYYKKASAKEVGLAQMRLARIYISKKEGNYNAKEAYLMAKRAIENNQPKAAYILGLGYAYGQGIKLDHSAALKYLSIAAEAGVVDAYTEAGLIQISNKQLPENYEKAFKLFRQGSNNGSAEATGYLGWFYEQGRIVKKNWQQAKQLYSRSCQQGVQPRCQSLKNINNRIEQRLASIERYRAKKKAEAVRSHQKRQPNKVSSASKRCSKTGYGPGNTVTCGINATVCEKTGFGKGNRVACGGRAKVCEKTGFGVGNDVACGGLAKVCEKTGFGKGNRTACGGRAKR